MHKRVLLGAARCGRSAVEPGSRRELHKTTRRQPTHEGLCERAAAGGALAAPVGARHGPAPSTDLSRGAAEGEGLPASAGQAPLLSAALLTTLKYSSRFKSSSKRPLHHQWAKRP